MIIKKFQEGGVAPEEAAMAQGAPAGAPAQGGDPMEQILQAAMQAVQTGDGQLALQVCAALVQLVQGAGPAPEEVGAAPEGEPVFRNGGVLAYRCGGKSKVKKAKCGGESLKCGGKAKKSKKC